MEINRTSFPHHLLGMLIDISEADFVSFDLELSGIPNRMPGRPKQQNDKQNLDERYRETKAGAEKYQILQVGFTCARFDYVERKYVLRPYNVNISPLLGDRSDIQREISFQSGAMSFLIENGFDIHLPFSEGVQYMSRDEAAQAKEKAYDRIDNKNNIRDIQLKDTDVDSLDFVRRAREAIIKWKTTNTMGLEITSHTGLENQPDIPTISNFEKRLVYQLVRAEFPDVVAMGRSDHIKIIDYDPIREADFARRNKNRAKDQITEQTGFRWVVEAMGRGKIDSIDAMYFAKNAEGIVIAADLDNIKSRFRRALIRLKDRQGVLVGHNMFTDIVYFYHTFIGKLPDTLDEFRDAVHELFPRIVDTKYLATHDGGDLNNSPTLQKIADDCAAQPLPDIVTHPKHQKYHSTEALHEAGYDSLLTATIMLRLSAKLGVEGNFPTHVSDSNSDTSFKTALEQQDPALLDGREHVTEPVALPPVKENETPSPKALPRQERGTAKKTGQKSKESVDRRFATKNTFDALRALSLYPDNEDEVEEDSGEQDDNKIEESQQANDIWRGEKFPEPDAKVYPIETVTRDPMELIPDFNSEFWNHFGNRLRVFGTEERVFHIAEWPKDRPRGVPDLD